MRQRRDGFIHRWMSGSRYRAVSRAALRGAGRAWHDLRFKDLYQSGKEFELMHRARPDTSGLPAGPWHKIWRQAVWLTALLGYIVAEATVATLTDGGLAGTTTVAVLAGIAFFW